MYAIVEIAGKQFKVQEDESLFIPYHRDLSPEDSVTFDQVLLVSDGDDVQVGTPTVEGASVEATVLDHVKGDKVIVFKKKRRKRYRVKKGHRQQFTEVRVNRLALDGEA